MPVPLNGARAAQIGRTALDRAPIEVLTWWGRGDTTDSESNPIAALLRTHGKRHPNDHVMPPRADVSPQVTALLRERMEHNDPPETFQANIGMRLLQWVLVNGFDDRHSALRPLDELMPEAEEWRRVFPPKLLGDLSYGGKMYAVATTIHRENSVLYNKSVFDKHGLELPKSVHDLPALGQKLARAGIPSRAPGA